MKKPNAMLRKIEAGADMKYRKAFLAKMDTLRQMCTKVWGLADGRLNEILQAEKDGRLVVLPCKPGDKVKVDVNSWGNVWNYKTYDFGKFLCGEIVSISITKKQFLMKIRVNHNVYWKRPMKRYPISALGKTVFLIREEAEAALKKREET